MSLETTLSYVTSGLKIQQCSV